MSHVQGIYQKYQKKTCGTDFQNREALFPWKSSRENIQLGISTFCKKMEQILGEKGSMSNTTGLQEVNVSCL